MDLAAPPVAGRAQGDRGNGDQDQHQWKAQ
jgi:hypothetical protein